MNDRCQTLTKSESYRRLSTCERKILLEFAKAQVCSGLIFPLWIELFPEPHLSFETVKSVSEPEKSGLSNP